MSIWIRVKAFRITPAGPESYDKHTGTDIRLLSEDAAKLGVAVKAAAKGIVRGARDGVDDRRVVSQEDLKSVANRECGNGVLVVHDGYETQYCHMLKGSVTVKRGDVVETGTALGKVGYSGEAAFAHLHFEVRKGAIPLDPFLGEPAKGECRTELGKAEAPATGLWTAELAKSVPYRGTEIIETGFADAALSTDTLEIGPSAYRLPQPKSAGFVFFTRVINARMGDILNITVSGPGGFDVASNGQPLDHSKATYVAFAGKKLKVAAWPAGNYVGKTQILRNGAVVAEASASFEMP